MSARSDMAAEVAAASQVSAELSGGLLAGQPIKSVHTATAQLNTPPVASLDIADRATCNRVALTGNTAELPVRNPLGRTPAVMGVEDASDDDDLFLAAAKAFDERFPGRGD